MEKARMERAIQKVVSQTERRIVKVTTRMETRKMVVKTRGLQMTKMLMTTKMMQTRMEKMVLLMTRMGQLYLMEPCPLMGTDPKKRTSRTCRLLGSCWR
jgi:hypothetical protein